MKVTFSLVTVIAVFCSSCTKHDSEFDQLKGRIADSVDLVNQCHKKVTYVDLQNELLHDFRNQKDAGERRNLARVWAERVRGVTPIGWAALDATSSAEIVKELPVSYNQIFEIDGQGGLKVDKFGQWVKRMPSKAIDNGSAFLSSRESS